MREAIRAPTHDRSSRGSARVPSLVLALAAVAVAAAMWGLREGWRTEPPMPEERPVVDEPIVHIPKAGVIVWVVAGNGDDVVPAVEALRRGGVTVVALQTMTPSFLQALARVRGAFARRVLVGAAGVGTAEEAREAVRAGAEFVLMTGVDPEATRACQDAGVLAIPSGFSPTEIAHAWSLRTGLVGVFPAGRVDSGYLRDVLRTMPDVRAVAAGGITPENAGDFVRAGAAAVVAIEESAAAARDYEGVTRQARALVDAVDRARARPVRLAPSPRPVEGPDVR